MKWAGPLGVDRVDRVDVSARSPRRRPASEAGHRAVAAPAPSRVGAHQSGRPRVDVLAVPLVDVAVSPLSWAAPLRL